MKWGKIVLVVFGALIITALGIDAADTIGGSEGTLLARVIQSDTTCKDGMIPIEGVPGVSCVDKYEASPSTICDFVRPASVQQSEQNLSNSKCGASSREGVYPWTNITLPQAQHACAASGKRLPTSEEWYKIAFGTHEEKCVVNATEPKILGDQSCESLVGAIDMVGNVWEWVEGDVYGNKIGNHTLPPEGYITGVTSSGLPATSQTGAGDTLFGDDYLWVKEEGTFNMIRGGFYGSESDAGVYTLNASVPIQFAVPGIGFRCVTS